jgi:hypothetical protein
MKQRERYELFLGLEAALGTEDAQRFMETVPTGPWSDVLTKRDLAAFEQRVGRRFDTLGKRFDAVGHRFEATEHEVETVTPRLGGSPGDLASAWTADVNSVIKAQTRTLVVANIVIMLLTAVLVFAAARLA